MIAQVLETPITTQKAPDHRGGGRRAQRMAELSISLRNKANTLMQLDLAGGDCFEQWQQMQRTITRVTWLWMALEFNKEEYRLRYQASI